MSLRAAAAACALLATTALVARAGHLLAIASAPPSLDAALADFWRADSEPGRKKAADRILQTNTQFDIVYQRLKEGRAYTKEKTGEMLVTVAADGQSFSNVVTIPDDYDPARRWPLRVQLHGGVGRAEPPEPGTRRNRLDGEPAIYAMPVAWSGTEWWRTVQLDNIAMLVERVKQRYNVDESRVYLTGTSDGGSGVYYHLLRDATRWSSGLPLIGNPKVLSSPTVDVEGRLFASNLLNRPVFAVNAVADPLYPAAMIQQWLQLLADGGVEVVFHTEPGGHGTSWWPAEREAFADFALSHPRPPHPDHLTWEIDRVDRYSRIQWLSIDELGITPSDEPLAEIGIYADPGGTPKALFGGSGGSGRVDVTRKGNHFEAHTRGVRAFTLLLSPEALDFARPISVTVNGIAIAETSVARDLPTLLRWAARDDDRTMLYAAELHVKVPDRHAP